MESKDLKKFTNKELWDIFKLAPPDKSDWVVKYVGANFVIPFTKPLIRLGFNAEQVCLTWILLGILSGVLFAFGNYWLGIAAILVYHISYILDGSDGAVARFRERCTTRGVYLDLIGHSAVKAALLLGIGIGAYINPPSYILIPKEFYFLAAGIAATAMTLVNLTRLKVYETLLDVKKLDDLVVKRNIFKPTKHGLFNLKKNFIDFLGMNPMGFFYVAAIFNITGVFILIYAVLVPLMFLARTYKEFNYIRRTIDEKPKEETISKE